MKTEAEKYLKTSEDGSISTVCDKEQKLLKTNTKKIIRLIF